MDAPTLHWTGAEVRDGVLTVAVEGDRPKGFKPAFERTVTLLGGGPAGAVRIKGATVRVLDVDEGSADTLHHFLESVLQEVNAALVGADSDDVDSAREEPDLDDADDADARMTERFRGLHDA